MADTKISALPNASALSGADFTVVVQGGVDKQMSLTQIATFTGGGGGSGTVTSVSGTGTAFGLTLTGTVTTSGNLTLGGTLAVPIANITATGTPSGTTYLRGDGTWATPGGGGTVTSVGGTGTVNGLTLTGTVTGAGNLTLGGTLTGVSLTTAVTGTLPVANGGTGITALGTSVATWLGTPSSANLAAAMTDETGSGALVFATSPTLVTPALGTPSALNLTNATVDGTNSPGFRGIPLNSQSAAYTTVLSDAGKAIYHPSTDANARTFTIDSNANVAYPVGTAITFINETSQVVTIAITADTLVLAGTGTTGSRSLAQYGEATAIKVGTTRWWINGVGLT